METIEMTRTEEVPQPQERDYLQGFNSLANPPTKPPENQWRVRFQRVQYFTIDVEARDLDSACAAAMTAFQANERKAGLLHTVFDYFTAENLAPKGV
ncbi:MAG: hypothetical protein DI551_11955 [Micavibrio aeruginosavorus]|jgi:hypothetical protein|uniref:Uncharacterized protein n=1 Tax=Micavibrio aeruginosavorus TaxID=349221 RepID=A0A2W5MSX8_9BACT|nr:MAG: hypothetical protein DI551_11955 [Micavibrio aeruginosavorus]